MEWRGNGFHEAACWMGLRKEKLGSLEERDDGINNWVVIPSKLLDLCNPDFMTSESSSPA